MDKYYLVYKITNLITRKYYIGAHETHDIADGYMGSGLYIKRAIKKYGVENFRKEVIAECSSSRDMFQMEAELVELHEMSYNIMPGGCGGWSYARSKMTADTYAKIKATRQTEEYKLKTADARFRSAKRMAQMQKDPAIRRKQIASLKRTTSDPNWISTTGVIRARKISETLRNKSHELMTEERNAKVARAMSGRVCVMLHGVKKRVKKDDPILTHPDIVVGWI